SAASNARWAEVIARRSSDVCTTSGRTSAWRISSPERTASRSPRGDKGTSTHPVNRFLAFHSLSPWRSRTRVPTLMRLACQQPCADCADGRAGSVVELCGVKHTSGYRYPETDWPDRTLAVTVRLPVN